MPIQVPSSQLRPGSIDVPTPVQSGSVSGAQRVSAAQTQRLARTLGQVGGQAAKIGTELYTQANDAMSKQQSVLHARELDNLLQDYQSKQGHDAYKGRKAFSTAAGKLRQKYAKTLENDDQTTLFNRMVDQQMAQAESRANAHNTRETRAWDAQMTQVNLNKYAQDYAAAAAEDDSGRPNLGELEKRRQIYEDSGLSPEEAEAELELEFGRLHRLGTARAAMEAEFMKLQRLAGMDEKTAREAMKLSVQKLHGATMTMLTDQDPKKARRYFQEHKDEMSAAQVTTVTEKLDKLDAEDKALATVREVMAGAGPDATPIQRYEALLDAAAKVDDADQFKHLISFGNAEYQRQLRLDAGRKNDLILSAEQLIYSDEGRDLTYEQLPPSMREGLEKNGLVDETMAIIGGRQRQTNAAKLLSVLQNPNQLKGMTAEAFERTYRPIMSATDYKLVTDAYNDVNGIQAASTPAGTPESTLFPFKDEVNTVLEEYGLGKESVKEDPSKAAMALRITERFEKMRERGRLTKEMTHEETMKTLRSVFQLEATIPKSFLGLDYLYPDEVKPYALLTEAEKQNALVTFTTIDGKIDQEKAGAIPGPPSQTTSGDPGVHAVIIGMMRSRGLDASMPNLLRVWDGIGRPMTNTQLKELTERNPRRMEEVLGLVGPMQSTTAQTLEGQSYAVGVPLTPEQKLVRETFGDKR